MKSETPQGVVLIEGKLSPQGAAIVRRCFGPHAAWRLLTVTDDGAQWTAAASVNNPGTRMTVIASVAVEEDGLPWLHLSVAHPKRLPDYAVLCWLKRDFLGPNAKAIEVYAPEGEHVNIHPTCRHLWACLGGDPLPDFTRGGRTI
jgi:hypothetical protein